MTEQESETERGAKPKIFKTGFFSAIVSVISVHNAYSHNMCEYNA